MLTACAAPFLAALRPTVGVAQQPRRVQRDAAQQARREPEHIVRASSMALERAQPGALHSHPAHNAGWRTRTNRSTTHSFMQAVHIDLRRGGGAWRHCWGPSARASSLCSLHTARISGNATIEGTTGAAAAGASPSAQQAVMGVPCGVPAPLAAVHLAAAPAAWHLQRIRVCWAHSTCSNG
jgi:hypothetical protein